MGEWAKIPGEKLQETSDLWNPKQRLLYQILTRIFLGDFPLFFCSAKKSVSIKNKKNQFFEDFTSTLQLNTLVWSSWCSETAAVWFDMQTFVGVLHF